MRYLDMRRSSRFVGILTSFVMVLSLTSNANANDGSFSDVVPLDKRQIQIVPIVPRAQDAGRSMQMTDFIGDLDSVGSQVSYLQTIGNDGKPQKFCDGWNIKECLAWAKKQDPVIGGLSGKINIPICAIDSTNACVEGLEITGSNGASSGEYIRNIDNTATDAHKQRLNELQSNCCESSIVSYAPTGWPASKSQNLPQATSPSLWNVPNQQNQGGSTTYMVQVYLEVQGEGVYGIKAAVVPYVEVSGSHFNPPVWYLRAPTIWSKVQGVHHDGGDNHIDFVNGVKNLDYFCAWKETGKCGIATRFQDDVNTKLSIRIPRNLGGWFYGRMSESQIELDPINSQVNRIVVSGKPVNVPIDRATWPLFDPEFKRYTDHWMKDYPGGTENYWYKYHKQKDAARLGGGLGGNWTPTQGVEIFKAYEPVMGGQANGSINRWSFATLGTWQTDNPCFADKTRVQGILTTNAMVYQAGLPTFSKGQLSYQVAGLHNNYDGSEFTGEYTLQMRADDARCLYGYSEAPIQTKVSVTDSGGTQKIATTSVSERDGWLTIRARNFTFSSPKIVVSIKQGKNGKAASTASVSVGKGKSLAAKTLMTKAKIKAKKGDKLDISVVGATTNGVTDAGKTLKFKSKGTYYVKVVVTRKNSSATSRVFKVVVK